MFPSLSEKYAVDALKFIYNKGTIKKTDLLEIITSSWTLDKLIPKLERDGLIIVKISEIGRKTYTISLTEKGRVAAEQLKKMDATAAMTETYELPPDFGKEFENLSAMTHLNVLEDHIAITEHNYDGTGKDRIVMVYVKLNGRGIMRLFCDVDDAYECRHTRYAWTLPSVQEMVQIQRDKGNVKE
ncbi:MAG: hypothetical protein ACYCT2_04420 [Thermoplasmataceae archaeon]